MHLRYSFRNLRHVYDENKRRKPPSIFEVKFDVNKFIIIAILFLEDSQMVETNWEFAYAMIYIYINCIRTIIRNTKKKIYIYIYYILLSVTSFLIWNHSKRNYAVPPKGWFSISNPLLSSFIKLLFVFASSLLLLALRRNNLSVSMYTQILMRTAGLKKCLLPKWWQFFNQYLLGMSVVTFYNLKSC